MSKRIAVSPWSPRQWPTLLGLGFVWLLAQLPRRSWPAVSRCFARGLQKLVPSRRGVVQRNLELAFPASDEQWRTDTNLKSYQALALSLLETAQLWFKEPAWLDDYVQIEGLQHLRDCAARGQAVMLVSCHYTSIEAAGAALCRAAPFYPVYAAAKNQSFDRFQIDKRRRFAPDVVLRSDMRKAMRVLRSGQVLWLLPDQAVDSSHGSEPTQFFGQPVLSSTGPGRLLKRSGASLVVFELSRQPGGILLTINEPSNAANEMSPVGLAQHLNDTFESMIRAEPSEYFWHHKRFKSGQPGVNPYR